MNDLEDDFPLEEEKEPSFLEVNFDHLENTIKAIGLFIGLLALISVYVFGVSLILTR